jgi:hypothetical protein
MNLHAEIFWKHVLDPDGGTERTQICDFLYRVEIERLSDADDVRRTIWMIFWGYGNESGSGSGIAWGDLDMMFLSLRSESDDDDGVSRIVSEREFVNDLVFLWLGTEILDVIVSRE